MKDFTLEIYRVLLEALISRSYEFQTFGEFMTKPIDRAVLLRHDIDSKKRSSLVFSSLEAQCGVKATYYFRAVGKIFDETIILKVAEQGHEVGYHYEDLSLMHGDFHKAYESFEKNLGRFRALYPVKTFCMHGNSLSRFDNRELWKDVDYKTKYGLIAEPYLDIDFDDVLYLTDSAQRWNGAGIVVRDKVETSLRYNFDTTFDILNKIDQLPPRIMMTVHPDRWTDNMLEWHWIDKTVKAKNFVKRRVLSKRAMVFRDRGPIPSAEEG